MRLNPNQTKHRASGIRAYLDDCTPEDAMKVLHKAGVIERMVDEGYMRIEGDVAIIDLDTAIQQIAPDGEPQNVQQQREALIAALAVRGQKDPAAANAWARLVGEEKVSDRWDINLWITPYRIKDTSLREIVMQCDLKIMADVFEGLRERFRMDEMDEYLREPFDYFARRFMDKYEDLYAPPLETS